MFKFIGKALLLGTLSTTLLLGSVLTPIRATFAQNIVDTGAEITALPVSQYGAYADWYIAAAQAIGIDVQLIYTASTPISEIAAANGVALADVQAFVVATESKMLQILVDDGKISTEQQAAALADLASRVDAFLTQPVMVVYTMDVYPIESVEVGICVIGVDSPCNGPEFKEPEPVYIHKVIYPDSWYQAVANLLKVSDIEQLKSGSVSIIDLAAQQNINLKVLSKAIQQVEKDRLLAMLGKKRVPSSLNTLFDAKTRTAIDNFLHQNTDANTTIEAQQLVWESWGIQNYQYEYGRSCFCFGALSYNVGVRNGVVSTAQVLATAGPIAIDENGNQIMPVVSAEELAQLPTIADLFKRASEAQAAGYVQVTVSYDPVYGFPTTIFTDYSTMMADDELGQSATNFRPSVR